MFLRRLTIWAALIVLQLTAHLAFGQRELGIDVSEYQGTINWPTVAKSTASGGGGKSFAFIRATRGAATGSLNVSPGRYDDPKFVTNITQARAAGLYVAPYHFARFDYYDPTDPSGTTSLSSPEIEADHFISIAGNYMTAGYMRPVLDLEASNTLTKSQLTNWALRFCARIMAVKGANVRPIIYCNISFSNDEIDTSTLTINGKATRLSDFSLWLARYSSSSDPLAGDPVPASGYSNSYGVFRTDSINDPNPWSFWQYSSTGTCAGITGAVDLDSVQSERQSLQSFVIGNVVPEPAIAVVLILPTTMLLRRR